MSPLVGGCNGYTDGTGGTGGGAIQIASRTKVTIAARGLIDVSGGPGGGIPGFMVTGGGGGGNVVLEAPSLSIAPGGALAGRGGSGATMRTSDSVVFDGVEGPTTGVVGAASVSCGTCGTSGSGGTEIDRPGNGTGASPSGGGGAVGRAVARNQTGFFAVPPGGARISLFTTTLSARSP